MENIELVIGIDNGVTGACCILGMDDEVHYFEVPTFKVPSSAKTKKGEGYITRIDHKKLYFQLEKIIANRKCVAVLERAMINPQRFRNSISAVRAFESTIITLEELGVSYEELDSRTWQHYLFEKGTKGRDNLKNASLHLSQEVFPKYHKEIQSHTDGDAFLIAYYKKQKILSEKE